MKRDKIPHSKQLKAWERALEQAQKALPLNRQQRKLCYVFKYNDDPQKAPKQNKSPEPVYKKKEKTSKRQAKVRARLTRRSCLLDGSKEVMDEVDFSESLSSTESLTTNVSLLPKEGESNVPSTLDDISSDVKLEDSAHNPGKVNLRRRGRSAANLSIDSGFVFDAIHVHPQLKEERMRTNIVSFRKADKFLSVEDVKDFKLDEEKVNTSRMPNSYRAAKCLPKKRQREYERDPIMKGAKKIKVEIVTRKHTVFEIIPKKMKNKQTQTPERKTKKGVTKKKEMKRKLELSSRSMKTKETSASRKFSQKAKVSSNKKGLTKKGLQEKSKKQKKAARQTSINCEPKKSVKERRIPTKRSSNDLEEQFKDDKEYKDVTANKQNLDTKFQLIDITQKGIKNRRQGRQQKLQKADKNSEEAHLMMLTDVAFSENQMVNGRVRDAQMEASPTRHVQETRMSESVGQQAKERARRGNTRSSSECLEGRKLRKGKIDLPYGALVTPAKKIESKSGRKPSRRSTRNIVTSHSYEKEHVIVCRVSQLPEIDDIVDENSGDSSGLNGINGRVNKRLFLEVLSNINAEIPIEYEGTGKRTNVLMDTNSNAEENRNIVLQETLPIEDDSRVCDDDQKSPSQVVNSLHENPISTDTNVEEDNGLYLNSGDKQIVEDHLHTSSNESPATFSMVECNKTLCSMTEPIGTPCSMKDSNDTPCSVTETNNKYFNGENSNLIQSCNPKMSVLFPPEDTSDKRPVPVLNRGGLGSDELDDVTQPDQHACTRDLDIDDANSVTAHPDHDTNADIEPNCVDIDAQRVLSGSHNVGFMNSGHGHEYFDNGTVRSDANPVFQHGDSVNHVEDTDLYLNDDDIGLPVTKTNQSCILTSGGSNNFGTSYCREAEPLSLLNKDCSAVPQFGKSNVDVSGMEEFQPAFSIPSLSLAEWNQPSPCYERRLENPCSVISTLPITNANIDHIPIRYFPSDEAITDSLAPHTTIGSTPLHSFNHYETLPGQLSGITSVSYGSLTSRNNEVGVNDVSYGAVELGECKPGLIENEKIPLIDSSIDNQVNHSSMLQNISEGIVDHSPDHAQNNDRDLYSDCNLSEDKEDCLPVMQNGRAESHATLSCDGKSGLVNDNQATLHCHGSGNKDSENQPTLSCHGNGDNDNNIPATLSFHGNVDCDNDDHAYTSKQNFCSSGKIELGQNDSISLDGQKSTTTMHQPITTSEGYGNDDIHEHITAQEYNGCEEVPEMDSANSSLSERQSPNEDDSLIDSSRITDDSSPIGNSLKRQRKRKTMSDFHVGLAFDEILSDKGRASDGDKGASKLSLTKKKRDNMKRIDYEEKGNDPDVTLQVEAEEDSQPKQVIKSKNRGRIEDCKRLGNKKRCSSSSEEQGNIGGSELTSAYRDRKPSVTNDEIGKTEEAVTLTPGVLLDVNDHVVEKPLEKKKRGRKPKVKSSKEESPVCKQADKPPPESGAKSVDMVRGRVEDLRGLLLVEEAKQLNMMRPVGRPRKNTVKGLPSKLKAGSDGMKPKRKYVKRKDPLKLKHSGKNKLKDREERIDELTQNITTVNLAEAKSTRVDFVAQKIKPKRKYNKKKKTANAAALGESENNTCKNVSKKYNKKSKLKQKRDKIKSFDDSNEDSIVGKKEARKRKSNKIECNSVNSESLKTTNVSKPKKYRKKNSVRDVAESVPTTGSEAKKRKKSEKKRKISSVLNEDIVSKNNSSRIIDERTSISENIIDTMKLKGDDNLQRSPLPCFDSKKGKRNEKLETRSNFSDENASISGKETDECGKHKKENICTICEQGDGLLTCNGVCYCSFHPDCLGLSTVPEKFFCDECLTGNHSCFLCKETGNLRKCSYSMCGKYYHDSCTQKMRGCKLEHNKLTCPLHICGTCSNDKESCNAKRRLIRCVRCPTAYHVSRCLVAGCVQLTNTLMVCNKHFVPQKNKPHHTHYNVSWCFVCSTGGMLVCCDSCPAAFHPGCVEDLVGVPDETWQCDSCREGKRPLYGDLVWVKYGFWRWWPAKICLPDEIPIRIQKLPHDVGEFPVMFFGSRDYCWLHAGRVFPYQEGDKGCKANKQNGTNKIFEKAIREVEEAHKELKEVQDKQLEQKLAKQSRKPPPYKQIKVNKYISALRNVVGPSEFTHCECSQSSESPCGPGSECINRMLQIECDKTCKAQEKCLNQRFQKCQQVDCVPVKTAHCGWGLQTRQAIKKGDFVIEYVGELIDEVTCRKRINDYHDQGISDYYFLVIDKDNIIDAYPKGNASRFMNHCCDPNCDTQKWTVNGDIRVGLFANSDIEAGSELTFNYNLDTLGNEKKACHCGSKNCSGFLGVRPKTQNAIALKEKKKEKKEKQKKKKKKDKSKMIRHEDECFVCGDGGELIMCDRTSCSKCYHLKCLTLSGMPKGKWDCPWHFCDVCGKRASYHCSICPNSFCTNHHEGEVLELSKGVYVCDEHTQMEVKEERNRLLVLKKRREEQAVMNKQSELSDNNHSGKT